MEGTRRRQSSETCWALRIITVAVTLLAMGCVTKSRFEEYKNTQDIAIDNIKETNTKHGGSLENLSKRIDSIENTMATKTELTSAKEEINKSITLLDKQLKDTIERLNKVDPEEINKSLTNLTAQISAARTTLAGQGQTLNTHATMLDDLSALIEKYNVEFKKTVEALDQSIQINTQTIDDKLARVDGKVSKDLAGLTQKVGEIQQLVGTIMQYQIDAFRKLGNDLNAAKRGATFEFPTPTPAASSFSMPETKPETE